jgi:hypothetical protein
MVLWPQKALPWPWGTLALDRAMTSVLANGYGTFGYARFWRVQLFRGFAWRIHRDRRKAAPFERCACIHLANLRCPKCQRRLRQLPLET